MVWENPARVEAAIRKLTRELRAIDDFLYGQNEHGDRSLYAGMLERKRDDAVRSGVLQMHTAIEDVLTEYLFCEILGATHRKSGRKRRTKRGQALSRMLAGPASLGFDMKLNFALVVGIISPKVREQLRALNALRNKCSHNWLLNVPAPTRKRSSGQPRPRLLNFRGRDLHRAEVLKDFLGEYGRLYVKLLLKSWGE